MSFRKTLSFFKKYWIALWLVFASTALFTVMIAFADYEEANNKIKRVFAPSAGSHPLFTSDYLDPGESGNIKSAFYRDGDSLEYDVNIRNYNPIDPNKIYDGTINYTLKATLTHKDGTPYNTTTGIGLPGQITVSIDEQSFTFTAGSSDTHTFTGLELSGKGTTGTDTCHVVYGSEFAIDCDYCITFLAEPVQTDLDKISATIQVSKYPETHTEGWTCVLADEVTDQTKTQYDGYNYTISGTGAKWLYFSYDSTRFEINTADYQLIDEIDAPIAYVTPATSPKGNENWKTVVIHANPEATGSSKDVYRYDIQLYKKVTNWDASKSELDPSNEATTSYVEFWSRDDNI